MQSRWHLIAIIAVMLALSACAAPTASPSPTAQPTPLPPSPTAVPSATVSSSVSSQPPAPTSTAAATAPAATASLAPATATVTRPTATTAPTQAAQPKSTAAIKGKINFNDYFPAGPGRDLVLESCMGCHSIAPILVLRKTRGEWEATAENHREYVSRLADAEYKSIFEYLIANFHPGKPVPELPPELLTGFTNY